jgi:hypothetical protein
MRNTQNIYLTQGDRQNIIIRGIDINARVAKTYGEHYVGNVNSVKQINGKTALAYAIFNTKIVDIDDNSIL